MQLKFGAFIFDDGAHELRCGKRRIHLSTKAFDLLGVLVRRRPNVVSKTDLHQELWPDTFVSDGSLAVLVAEIRRAFGDTAQHSSFVRTVSRLGYAFIGTISDSVDISPERQSGGAYWLTWASERASLKLGENVVGRDPRASIYIDAIGVSRRHAVIIVSETDVMIRDLSSKNGTFVDGQRITAAVRLADNAEIRVGPLCVRFHRTGLQTATQTVNPSEHPRR